MATSDTATGAKVKAYSVTGPASYATGGFLHDASADFSWVGFCDVTVTTRGSLAPCDFEYLLNKDLSSVEALGKAVIKVVRGRYDKATMGNVTGQPGGVTVQSAKTATATTTGSSHNHAINHDHAAVTSATETASGAAVNLSVGGGAAGGHTHSFDVPSLTGNTTSDTHTHDRAFAYDHAHTSTVATVDCSPVEVANGTDLSATTFAVLVYGFGKG